ncbi:hypothetical protein AWB81_07451 [Caballeronia arationis]|uniref:hypothetical protein n=1 Tax=Caballeronia arationis TaxID=1777142 RepID=UPI00074BDAF0|nr:hypothetical protein [Caballeronia arationis]SAL06117.1 hypothetical protein AWB81_07451 [Caballeronia arationis]
MIPTRANDKLRKFLEAEAELEKLPTVPSYLEGKQVENGLAAHWQPEYAREDIRLLSQRLAQLDALTGADRTAAEAERAKIQALIGDRAGDLMG